MEQIPSKQHSEAFAPAERLRELLMHCRASGVSEESHHVLAELCDMRPAVRLVRNLEIVVKQMVDGPIYDVLGEGLTAEEQAVLVELDRRGLPVRDRETAHGLYNIHERWRLLKEMRRPFKQAVAARDKFLRESGSGRDATP